jgi:hypothetical protein
MGPSDLSAQKTEQLLADRQQIRHMLHGLHASCVAYHAVMSLPCRGHVTVEGYLHFPNAKSMLGARLFSTVPNLRRLRPLNISPAPNPRSTETVHGMAHLYTVYIVPA